MTKSLPADVSLADICWLLGVTKQRIGQLEAEGIIERTARGRYALASVPRFIKAQRKATAGPKALQDVRLELMQEKSSMARLEREAWLKQWLPRGPMMAAITSIMAVCRTRLLGIGAQSASRLAAERSPTGCAAIVDEKIREALDELSRLPVVCDQELVRVRPVPAESNIDV
jgi:hypothetical protein